MDTQYNTTYEFDFTGKIQFGDMPVEQLQKLFQDGRVASKFLEHTIPTWFPDLEFVDAKGQVFALRWSGPDLPDMGMLLGSYLPVFKASVQVARQAGKRGGPVVVQSGGMVMVSTGVMGAFQGYAYLESLVPMGLDVQSLLK